MPAFQQLVDDDQGFVVTVELILITTIVVLGLITGLSAVRDAVVSELSDVATSVQELNQSYSYNGVTGGDEESGSEFVDREDWAGPPGPGGGVDACIQFYGVADEN